MNTARIAGLIAITILAIVYVRWWIWFAARSTQSALREWQKGAGYTIVAKRYRAWFRGPFYNASSTMQAVYRLDLEDKRGDRRRAWARCGHRLTGTFLEPIEIKVILDDESQEPSPLHD
jgi:hypothetical protein